MGAVGNGLELICEEAAEDVSGAAELAARSSTQAVNLLQFYRAAYGRTGGAALSDPSQLRRLAHGVFDNTRIKLFWPERLAEEMPAAQAKLLLNLLTVAAEALPRGGDISLSAGEARRGGGAGLLQASAEGQGAALKEDLRAALAGELPEESLTPRNVHGAYARELAWRLGLALRVESAADRVVVAAVAADPPAS